MEGLLSELNIISPTDKKSLKGNVYWYKEEIEKNNPNGLDHPVNRIHIENYIARLNGKYFNKEGFALISNINDKIYQLNHHILERKG